MSEFQHSILVKDEYYNAFPSIARAGDGSLVLVYRQAPDTKRTYGATTHVDPSSRIMSMRSCDEGETWFEPKELYSDEMGEQDPCLTSLADGTLVCTFFRWRVVPAEEKESLGEAFKHYGRIIFDRWAAVHIGSSCLRSFDHGGTWDGPWPIEPTGYEGPAALRGNLVELPDGRILAPLYGVKRFGELSRCLVMCSEDTGRSWRFHGDVPHLDGHHFVEPFLYRAPSGRLDMLMRTQLDFLKIPFDRTYRNLHAASSFDNGKTWGNPCETGLFCPNPVHALPVAGNKVCITFGQRRDPMGIEALVTDAEHPVLSDSVKRMVLPTKSGDLGYTSAVSLRDSSVLIVYYLTDQDGDACIGSSRMEVDANE